VPEDAREVIRGLLKMNPKSRMTIPDILETKFIKKYQFDKQEDSTTREISVNLKPKRTTERREPSLMNLSQDKSTVGVNLTNKVVKIAQEPFACYRQMDHYTEATKVLGSACETPIIKDKYWMPNSPLMNTHQKSECLKTIPINLNLKEP